VRGAAHGSARADPAHPPATVVDIECSAAAPCPGVVFENFDVAPPAGSRPRYICQNVLSESGLDGALSTFAPSNALIVRTAI
jgi:hypothetical protein